MEICLVIMLWAMLLCLYLPFQKCLFNFQMHYRIEEPSLLKFPNAANPADKSQPVTFVHVY